MTDLDKLQNLYLALSIAFSNGPGYFLPPGKVGQENMVACEYVSFLTEDGNRVTHYFTSAGVYWTTYTGHKFLT